LVARWIAARREALLLAVILAVGAALRLYGLNWDGGHWLHPDERQIYFIVQDLGWPHSPAEALSPDSPLNPQFFAYGSLPIYLLKIVAALLAPLSSVLRDPDNLHLVGRPLAALFDLGTVYLTYRLAKRLERRGWAALFATALVGLAVLNIQLAHFYTADTLLTFFVMLTLNQAAMATKISAAPVLLVVLVAYGLRQTLRATHPLPRVTKFAPIIRGVALTGIVAGAVFGAVHPYALVDWRTFLADTIRESQIAWGTLDVPYTRQYAQTLPYLYSIWQTALWGLGLPLGLVAWAGFVTAVIRWLRHGPWTDTLLLAWAGPYLALVGLFHTRYLRYMLPLVPMLCILAASGQRTAVSGQPSAFRQRLLSIGHWLLLTCVFTYSLLFVGIYAKPHSWIAASRWIYDNVPAGSTLAVEDWDTALPLPLDMNNQPRRIEEYDVRFLTLYDEPDDAAKWTALTADLSESDYVVVASRRLYGSIPRLPGRYPLASRYYDQLFAGELGFELAGEFLRGAGWLNPRLAPLPDAAPGSLQPDESFVVYDHPRTLIFRNVERLSAGELLRRLADG
jgi:hypothetical protein